ncbi:hypothetical protein YC2023_094546 [Brassica napus]
MSDTRGIESFKINSFFFLFYNPIIRIIPSRPIETGEEDPRDQTETILNLWPRLELVMADTSIKIPLPLDHEAQLINSFILLTFAVADGCRKLYKLNNGGATRDRGSVSADGDRKVGSEAKKQKVREKEKSSRIGLNWFLRKEKIEISIIEEEIEVGWNNFTSKCYYRDENSNGLKMILGHLQLNSKILFYYEKEGSFDSDSVAHSVRLAMIDDACESIREKAKLMKGLFGNTDENSRNVDKLVSYMTSEN